MFKPGDKIWDQTAILNGWPDKTGVVVEVDGSNVKVRYDSGVERWKANINLWIREDGVKGGIIGIEEQGRVTHDDWEHILSRLQKKPPQD